MNAGGSDLLGSDDDIEENENSTKKNKSVNYGKISTAIGESRSRGILVLPPDINNSDLIFKPDFKKNAIIYGFKGINRIGSQLIYDIIKNRPYTSIEDFLNKIKISKPQMINLIKSGAFDNLYQETREEIMNKYLDLISDKKKRITLQNMPLLISKGLIPKELDFERRLFNFNKYLKGFKEGNYYRLDERSFSFFTNNYDEDILESVEIRNNRQTALIKQTIWDNTYKAGMDSVRKWMKNNQEEILKEVNRVLLDEAAEKYTEGNISKWEMDSLSFYYHEHELSKLKNEVYGITNYFDLPTTPEIDRTFDSKDGKKINLFKITRIAGTVIDKNKDKSTVTLLTINGVVTVKVWKNQFAEWDKQISERDSEGIKHVLEKSWFTRGVKLIITGIRRDDMFIPKKYKDTPYPLFERIDELDDRGFIVESTVERLDIGD